MNFTFQGLSFYKPTQIVLLIDITYVGKQNCNTGKFKDFSYMYNDFYLTKKKKKKKKITPHYGICQKVLRQCRMCSLMP